MHIKLNAASLVCLSLLSTVAFSQQTQPLNNATLVQYVNANRYGSGQRDPFAPSSPVATLEQNVSLTIPIPLFVRDPTVRDRIYLTYNYEAKVMTVHARNTTNDLLSLERGTVVFERPTQMARVIGWTVSHKAPRTKSTAQNIYGASFEVENWNVEEIGFGEFQITSEYEANKVDKETIYQHSWRVEPEAARSLSENLELQIIGRTREFAAGKKVICNSWSTSATFQQPSNWFYNECHLTGVVDLVRIADKRDATVIKEWSTAR
jgi:hypothetical protein